MVNVLLFFYCKINLIHRENKYFVSHLNDTWVKKKSNLNYFLT